MCPIITEILKAAAPKILERSAISLDIKLEGWSGAFAIVGCVSSIAAATVYGLKVRAEQKHILEEKKTDEAIKGNPLPSMNSNSCNNAGSSHIEQEVSQEQSHDTEEANEPP